jgi:hypothetical protein
LVKTGFGVAFALPVALFGMAIALGGGCGSSGSSTTDAGGGHGGKAGATAGTSGGGIGGGVAGISGGGTGGSAAGTGGGGIGGSAAGTSGGGTGGSAAGTSGGGTAGTGTDAGVDARQDAEADTRRDAEADAHKDAEGDAHDAAPVCTDACTLGAHRCAGGGSELCVRGSNTCTEWGAASACAGVTTCAASSGVCTCPAAPTGCTAAGTFCDTSGELVTCNRDAQGCFSDTTPVACPADTSCKGTLPNAACTCDNNASCSGTNSFCLGTSTVEHCGLDSNTPACNIVTSTTACGGSSFCLGGACVCPAVGTTAGTGCATLNATSCSGTDILTCVTESASGCNVWQASTHCGDTGFTCGTQGGGAPSCQCPANSGTDIYVDPVAGSDLVAGVGAVYPTGIQTPAACRFASLTKGLATVGSPGRVIAISATLPVTFGAETFPINVPSSVSVLTADAVFTPADYVISSNAAGTLITLANGSALRGFSVVGNGAAQALISCSAGSPVLDTLALDGSGTVVDGVDVLGTCAASLNAVTIGDLTGVALNVSSSAPSTLTGGMLGTSKIGLQQTGGSVSATDLAIENNGNYGVLLPASSPGTPTLTLSSGSAVNDNGSAGVFAGISIAKGSLTASNATVQGNGGIGIQLTSAAGSHQLTTVQVVGNGTKSASFGVALTAGTLAASGLSVTTSSDSGVSISGGGATLTGAALTANTGRGLIVSGSSTVTVSGGTFNSNGLAGIFGTAGTLNVLGATELASNGTHGLHVTGATTVINGANIHDNTDDGVLVNETTGVTVNIGTAATTTTINHNGIDGILVDAAPPTSGSGANSLTIDTVAVGNNGKFGIYLEGDTGSVAATIKGSTIITNGDVGIMVEEGTGNTTAEAIQNNDVNGNNTNAATTHAVGGILFNTASTLSSFIGNKVHSNGGDELGFNAAPNGALRWVINPPSAACDATANSLYCYGNGNVGLHLLATGVTVDAQHVHWATTNPQNPPPPTSGIDFSGPTNSITVSNWCTPIATCP